MKHCKLTATLFILFVSLNLNAQLSFGVKAELGSTNAPSEESYAVSADDVISYQLSYSKTSPIKTIGVYSQMESGFLFFRPEVTYSSSKRYYSVMNFISDDPIDIEMIELNETVDATIIGGILIKPINVRIGVGPSFHFLAKKENPLETIDEIEFNSRKLTTGFNFDIGYDLGRLSFDLKYEDVFSTVGDHIIIENQKSSLKSSPDKFSFAIGLKF